MMKKFTVVVKEVIGEQHDPCPKMGFSIAAASGSEARRTASRKFTSLHGAKYTLLACTVTEGNVCILMSRKALEGGPVDSSFVWRRPPKTVER